MSGVFNLMRPAKGAATKKLVFYPNIMKLYNIGMGGVEIMDQRTTGYRLDREIKYWESKIVILGIQFDYKGNN